MRMPPYPRYKQSGVDWLGLVPEHWDLRRMSLLARPGRRTFTDGDWIELPYITNEGIRLIQTGNIGIGAYREQGFRYIEQTTFVSLNCTEVRFGDVLICRLAEPVGRACLAPDLGIRMITSVDVCVLKLENSIEKKFIIYFLSSKPYLDYLQSICRGGTRDRVSRSMLGAIRVPIPPKGEQSTIACFLDWKTTEIDGLIEKKQALIEMLREKRAALIWRTVTRGLPPEASRTMGLEPHSKFKPSGAKWIGDIPAPWDLIPLGYLTYFQGGATPDKNRPEFWDGDIPWVSPKDMKVAIIRDADDHISQQALWESPLSMVPVGAVLIVVRGMILAHSFPVAVVQAPVTINQDMKAIISRDRIQSRFLFWLMVGFERTFVSLADESAHGTRKLETVILKRFPIGLPPTPEQRAIADYLDRETTDIDRLLQKVERAVERLAEYRTALVTAAVTGKLDLRETIPAKRPARLVAAD